MAEGLSPFRHLLNPNQPGTLMGFLGQLSGQPTTSERVGAVRQQALAEFARLRQQGLDPQAALLKTVQSPTGQDWFATDPNLEQGLQAFMTATTAPVPSLHNVPEGNTVLSQDPRSGATTPVFSAPKTFPPQSLDARTVRAGPGDKVYDEQGNLIAANPALPQSVNSPAGSRPGTFDPNTGQTTFGAPTPTTETQNFQEMTAIAGLPGDAVRTLAELKMRPTSTEKERAVDILVKKHGLDPQIGEKIKADIYEVKPILNQFGDTTGYVLTDKTDPTTARMIDIQGGASRPGTPKADAPPPVINPDAVTTGPDGKTLINPYLVFNDKTNMFSGTGLVPSAVDSLSTVLETFSPSSALPAAEKIRANQNHLQHLKLMLSELASAGEGLGIPTVKLKEWMEIGNWGPTITPNKAVLRGMALYKEMKGELARAEAIEADPNMPTEEKKRSAARRVKFQRVLDALPSLEKMQAYYTALSRGEAGALGVQEGIRQAKGAAAQGITQAKGAASEAVNGPTPTPQPAARTAPAAQPQAPAARRNDYPIETMPLSDLLAIDPATMSATDLAARNQRLRLMLEKRPQTKARPPREPVGVHFQNSGDFEPTALSPADRARANRLQPGAPRVGGPQGARSRGELVRRARELGRRP